MNSVELDQLFQQGVAAVRSGDKAKAREVLSNVVEANQLHEQAWLWLSAAVETNDERILCLNNVLTINPTNETAIKGLRKLGAPIPESAQPHAEEPQAAAPPSEPSAPPSDPFARADATDEGWRKKAYEDAIYTSDALIVKDKDEGPTRDFNDLVNAWLSALIFKIPGDYQEQVSYGSVGHIAINVAASVLLQVLTIVVFIGMFVATSRSPSYLVNAVTKSSQEMSAAAAQLSLANFAPEPLRPAIRYLFPEAGRGVRLPVLTAAVVASFGALLLAVLIWNILSTFVFLMFQALVVSRVSEWLGGKGDVFGTTQGLSLALVASSLINVPLAMIAAVVPLEILFTLLAISAIYQFVQTGLAISAAHRLNILVSLGAVIISNSVTNVGLSCIAGLIGFLVARVSG